MLATAQRRPQPAPRLRDRGRHRRCTCRASSRRRCRARATARSLPPDAGGEVVVVSTRPTMTVVEHHRAARTATSRTSRSRAAACPTISAPWRISPDGCSGLGAVEAGQHRARHAAQRRQPELPEHGARDQLAHRPRRRAPRTALAHRPRQRERGERGGVRSVRRLPVRRARDQPRSGRARCARRLRDVPLRRRPRAAGPGGVADGTTPVRQQLHGPHRRRVRPARAARRAANRTCRRWRRCARGRDGEARRRRCCGQAALLRRARHAPRARRAT